MVTHHQLAACGILLVLCTAACGAAAAAPAPSSVDGAAAQLSADVVVQRQKDAFNNADLDAYMALLADDCVVRDLNSSAVLAQGTEQLRARYEGKFAAGMKSELLGRLVLGDVVVDREVVRGSDGQAHDGLLTYTVRDGLIRRIDLMFQPRT